MSGSGSGARVATSGAGGSTDGVTSAKNVQEGMGSGDAVGALAFPFQMVVLLSEPGRDFSGGEFALVEQRPRMQSRLEVVPLAQGEGAIFAVRDRPVRGTRGTYRVTLRHGVSRVRAGERFTLGIIFHDAR